VMHQLHVTQANKGCDFDFLEEPVAASSSETVAAATSAHRDEPEIH